MRSLNSRTKSSREQSSETIGKNSHHKIIIFFPYGCSNSIVVHAVVQYNCNKNCTQTKINIILI